MAKKANGTTRGKKQLQIAGTERPDDIDEVDVAIESYLSAKAERQKLQEEEREALQLIQSLLQENRRKRYVYVDGEWTFTCTLEAKTKLRFKRERVKQDESDEVGTDEAVDEDAQAEAH